MRVRRVKSLIRAACYAAVIAGAFGCRGDQGKPTSPEHGDAEFNINPTQIKLVYTCGNTFRVRNFNPDSASITYQVGTGAQQPLELPAPPVGVAYSELFFVTGTKGTVKLFYQGTQFASVNNGNKTCPVPVTKGAWGPLFPWPIVAVHASLLPDGNVISWQRYDSLGGPQVWNPTTGAFTEVPVPVNIFCGGQTLLPDGRLLVNGGHISLDMGLRTTYLFDYATQTWTQGNDMRAGRWYPTTTSLASGEVLTMSGGEEDGQLNLIPEIYELNGTWRALTTASRAVSYYPYVYVLPDGRIFMAGPDKQTGFLDPTGTGAWTDGPPSAYGQRSYGSSVMYEPGKILIFGGGNPQPTKTAEVIDFNGSGTWRTVAPLPTARRQTIATMLPDGKVLVTAGTSGPGFNSGQGAQKPALIWNPQKEVFVTMASMAVARLYHSTALLLPDGRVLVAGSGQEPAPIETDRFDAQIYSPPYLFKPSGGAAARPLVTAAPTELTYGAPFQVDTPHASEITSVTLVRLGSMTHAFDQNQRFMRLSFVRQPGILTVTAPANANLAPPGHYMLFLVNANGVPSVANILHIQ